MRRAIVLLAVFGAILAEAPLPYQYQPPQLQVHHHSHHGHDQLNGFRPSHGYPCPDGIAHQNTEGRIINQHFETSGEPILAQQLPRIVHSDKQVTVNSKIAFGEHSHSQGEFISTPTKAYIPPPPPVNTQQLPTYGQPPLPIQHQPINFHGSGSIVHGVGKAPPPFALNHHYHQHPIPVQQHRPLPIPVQQHRPLPSIPQNQPQYLPPRQTFVQQNNFVHNQAHANSQAISVPAPLIDNLIPPPIGQNHGKFIEQNQFTSPELYGSNGGFGGSIESGSLNTISSGSSTFGSSSGSSSGFDQSLNTISTGLSSSSSSFGSSSGSLNGFVNSGSSSYSGESSSGSLGFTSIGSTHNFNHPGLDEGLSQVISETFANSGVGENVEKHIYVHVPPEDLEERGHQHIQQQLPVSQPKKHYKIIFIKAPNQQPSTNVYTQIAQQQASEEKTLVYVLVKKPDEPTIQDIQQIQSTYKPSKPEVYFIKYKTHKDHEGVGHQGVENVDLTNGNFQGSDLNGGIDIRGGFNGESNAIHDALSSSIIQPRIPFGNIPAPVYGPPEPHH